MAKFAKRGSNLRARAICGFHRLGSKWSWSTLRGTGTKSPGVLSEEPVQNHLAAFLDSWMQMHESNIYARLEFPYGNLDLAVNVFVCASCEDDLIGLKDLRSHFKCIGPKFDFRFSFAGRARALALVDLLGMDPKTATANILDASDARFFCEGCKNRGAFGHQALTWRECVSRAILLISKADMRFE